ncbi:MAG: substrate-binding domain-containing protein [Nitrospira sp.]
MLEKSALFQTQLWHLWLGLLLLSVPLFQTTAVSEELKGGLIVVGRGPEHTIIEQLTKAFEKDHFGTAVDIRWNRNFHIANMVASGEADIAVSGREELGLTATTIAWDGLAVIVNFSNPVKEMTKEQVASLFSGSIREWSELDEKANGKVKVILRPDDQNLNDGFAQSLEIVGRMTKNAEHLSSDQQVLSRVSGQLNAVGYLSLQAALDAVTYGVSVRILVINGVEAGTPTLQSGQYPLKRPLVLLMRTAPSALTRAFVESARSSAGQTILGNGYVPLAP